MNAKSLVFPCIGTGAFGWPPEIAADAAFKAIRDWLDDGNMTPEAVSFVCPNAAFVAIYQQYCADWLGDQQDNGANNV